MRNIPDIPMVEGAPEELVTLLNDRLRRMETAASPTTSTRNVFNEWILTAEYRLEDLE